MSPVSQSATPVRKGPPKGAKYKVVLETGRVMYFREPRWGDLRNAAQMSSDSSSQGQAFGYLEGIISAQALALFRANGEEVDITDRANLFGKILTLAECLQLSQHPQAIGIDMEKKSPEVTIL